MPLFGSHLSIAGGFYKAVEAAAALGMETVQIFTHSPSQWAVKPAASSSDDWVGKSVAEADAVRFAEALRTTGVGAPISHDSYLINLGTTDDALWNKSIAAMAAELERSHALGVAWVVSHPGAHVGAGEAVGLARVAAGLDEVFARTANLAVGVALETTAGQGTCLGWRFEHLAEIIDRCAFRDRLRVCVDTCHVFAAGYELAPKRKYQATMKEFDRVVGVDKVVAFHLNDSKKPLGSRVDRHEHLGRGCLGLEPFANVVKDKRFKTAPMILETAKEDDPETGRPMDAVNLEILHGLAGS
ncbi:MAG: deoxyribonuclease IV [Planctomycetia bacterium]